VSAIDARSAWIQLPDLTSSIVNYSFPVPARHPRSNERTAVIEIDSDLAVFSVMPRTNRRRRDDLCRSHVGAVVAVPDRDRSVGADLATTRLATVCPAAKLSDDEFGRATPVGHVVR